VALAFEAPNLYVQPDGGVTLSFQWLTSSSASTEPRPLAASYPGPALKPATPGTELFPVVTSWKTLAPPLDWLAASL
jgi:hypothetical protein